MRMLPCSMHAHLRQHCWDMHMLRTQHRVFEGAGVCPDVKPIYGLLMHFRARYHCHYLYYDCYCLPVDAVKAKGRHGGPMLDRLGQLSL